MFRSIFMFLLALSFSFAQEKDLSYLDQTSRKQAFLNCQKNGGKIQKIKSEVNGKICFQEVVCVESDSSGHIDAKHVLGNENCISQSELDDIAFRNTPAGSEIYEYNSGCKGRKTDASGNCNRRVIDFGGYYANISTTHHCSQVCSAARSTKGRVSSPALYGAIGAGAGALVGHKVSDKIGTGAAIGAGVGILGGIINYKKRKSRNKDQCIQCLLNYRSSQCLLRGSNATDCVSFHQRGEGTPTEIIVDDGSIGCTSGVATHRCVSEEVLRKSLGRNDEKCEGCKKGRKSPFNGWYALGQLFNAAGQATGPVFNYLLGKKYADACPTQANAYYNAISEYNRNELARDELAAQEQRPGVGDYTKPKQFNCNGQGFNQFAGFSGGFPGNGFGFNPHFGGAYGGFNQGLGGFNPYGGFGGMLGFNLGGGGFNSSFNRFNSWNGGSYTSPWGQGGYGFQGRRAGPWGTGINGFPGYGGGFSGGFNAGFGTGFGGSPGFAGGRFGGPGGFGGGFNGGFGGSGGFAGGWGGQGGFGGGYNGSGINPWTNGQFGAGGRGGFNGGRGFSQRQFVDPWRAMDIQNAAKYRDAQGYQNNLWNSNQFNMPFSQPWGSPFGF